jgi:hypothetical protein
MSKFYMYYSLNLIKHTQDKPWDPVYLSNKNKSIIIIMDNMEIIKPYNNDIFNSCSTKLPFFLNENLAKS